MSILPFFSVPTYYRIQQQPPIGIKDPVVNSAMLDIYTAINLLIFQQQPGQPQGTIIGGSASEAILLGAPINLFNSGGKLTIRNANSTNSTRPCHGFCVQLNGIASGGQGSVDCGIRIVPAIGLTLGADYWLGPTNGGLITAPDTAAGHIEQYLGIAVSATQLMVKPTDWIQH